MLLLCTIFRSVNGNFNCCCCCYCCDCWWNVGQWMGYTERFQRKKVGSASWSGRDCDEDPCSREHWRRDTAGNGVRAEARWAVTVASTTSSSCCQWRSRPSRTSCYYWPQRPSVGTGSKAAEAAAACCCSPQSILPSKSRLRRHRKCLRPASESPSLRPNPAQHCN